MTSRRFASACALGALLIGSPAFAAGQAPELSYEPVPPGADYSVPFPAPMPNETAQAGPPVAEHDLARTEWLERCRAHYRDNGLGGALIGGAIGGIAGNRIAGRGDRTVGTIAGAAVGAVAGAAIDKAEDQSRVRDACEDYLDRYSAYYSAGGPSAGYYHAGDYAGYSPYGFGGGYMMVPVRTNRGCCCNEPEVIEEIVDVPVARRVIPRRPADKRIKLVPDKRIK